MRRKVPCPPNNTPTENYLKILKENPLPININDKKNKESNSCIYDVHVVRDKKTGIIKWHNGSDFNLSNSKLRLRQKNKVGMYSDSKFPMIIIFHQWETILRPELIKN